MTRAVLLVDHGSRLAEANAILEELAAQLRSRLPDHIVEVAHMELAKPTVADGVEACVAAGATQIAVHPHFLGPGRHLTRDIPQLLQDATARHSGVTVTIMPPLGAHEKLVDLVLERVKETDR